MKKAVRLFLAFVLVLTLVCSMVSVGFAKSISEGSWTVYDNSTTVLGNGGKLTYTTSAAVNLVTDRLYTGADADNDSKAFKLESGCYAQWPSIKISFNKNTLYTLSGYYYGEAIDGVQGMFSDAVIIKDGGGKTNKADHLSYLGRNDGYYLDENGGYTTVADRINSGVQAKKWNKIVLTFYSGENTSAVFALRPTVGNQAIYLDNLQLNIADIEANDWNMYDNSTAKIGTGGTLRPANQYTIIKTEEKIYSGEGADDDGTSIAVTGGFAQYVTRKIAVEKNKNYEYTLYYYSNSLNASGGIFSHALAMPDGGAKFDGSLFYMDANGGYCVNAAGEKLTIKQSSIKNATAGAWNKVTISFNSGNLTEMLMVFRPTNQDVVYFDGFSLKEITKLPGVNMDNSDWKIYDFSTTIIGEGGKSTYSSGAEVTIDTENVYTGEGADNDGKAYCFSGPCYAQYVTQIKEFEANSYYKVTLYYKAAQLDDQGGIFSDLRMVRNGGEQNATSVDNLGAINRDRSYYTNKNGTQIDFTNRINSNVKANEWNEVTIPFYSGNLSEVLLAIRSTVAIVYIDNIKLSAVSTLPSGNLFPNGWTVYKMESVGAEEHTTAVVGDSTEFVHSEGGDGKSVALMPSTYAQYAAMPMATEKNQYYTLEFYYLSDAINTAWGNNYILSHIYVSAGATGNLADTALAAVSTDYNGTVKKNGVGISVPGFTTRGVQPNEWVKTKITFYSGDNTQVRFAVRPAVTDKTTIYLDDITLNKVSISTAYNNMAAVREAKDSNIGKNGLRVYNSVQTDWLNEAEGNIVEYGSIAVKEEYLAEAYEDKAAPDMSMIIANDKKLGLGVAYRAEGATTVTGSDAKNIHWEENNTDDIFARKVFTSYLTGISKENYGKDYLIRTYAIDAEGNIFYGDTVSVCIFDVVWAISVANNSENVADNDAFKSFVIDSGVQAEYEAWCTENSRDFGGLYNALTAE